MSYNIKLWSRQLETIEGDRLTLMKKIAKEQLRKEAEDGLLEAKENKLDELFGCCWDDEEEDNNQFMIVREIYDWSGDKHPGLKNIGVVKGYVRGTAIVALMNHTIEDGFQSIKYHLDDLKYLVADDLKHRL